MTWLLIGASIWVALAVLVAILVGRSIRLADARRALETPTAPEDNFVVEPTPAPVEETYTGPSTVPFAPMRPAWGGDRTVPRPRATVIHTPVRPAERDPKARDSGKN